MIEKRNIVKNNRKIRRGDLHLKRRYERTGFPNKISNTKVKIILVFFLSIFFFTSVSAQPNELAAKYSIHMLGTTIGEFAVTQTYNKENINIYAITEINVKLLFSFHIKYVQSSVYNQGVLQSAHVESFKNGKLNSTMCMKYEKGSYKLIVDGDTTIINDAITYSGSLIYFNEPKTATRIFKERNAEMRQIALAGNHTYTIKDEKGKLLNKYFYEDGILQQATMRHALATVELKLVNE